MKDAAIYILFQRLTNQRQGRYTLGGICGLLVFTVCVCCMCAGLPFALSDSDRSTVAEARPTRARVTPVTFATLAPVEGEAAPAEQAPAPLAPAEEPTVAVEPVVPTEPPPPTDTPAPTFPAFEPVIFNGSGDMIVDVVKPDGPALARISGNGEGRAFSIKNLGSDNQSIDLLVNTADPYQGVVPLDLRSGEQTVRLEIAAAGEWSIEIHPISTARVLVVPGLIEGTGDEVLLLGGSPPDTAQISGNEASRAFSIFSYGPRSDLLVNTADPYAGQVLIPAETQLLKVTAVGGWRIEMAAK